MELFLVRHAEAVERSDNLQEEVRWLTPKGRKLMQKASARLHKKNIRPVRIITSPLTRAVQTAELLMAELGKHTELIADSRLAPDSSLEALLELIQQSKDQQRVVLVGHEPLLSTLATALLQRELLGSLGKASCLALELRAKPGKAAKFLWYQPTAGKTVSSPRKALAPARPTP